MGGDFEDAERAFEDAEIAGASRAWIDFLQGLTRFFVCEYDEAYRKFTEASELQPNFTAAHAMRAISRGYSGDYAGYLRLQRKVPAPSNEWDVFYAAYSRKLVDPVLAVEQMSEALADRRSWAAGQALLAEGFATAALATDNSTFADEALDAIGIAKVMLPDNPYVPMIDLCVHQAALQVGTKRDISAEDLHAEASQIAARIEEDYPRFGHPAAWFRDWEGDEERALRCWQLGVENYPGSADFVKHQCMAFLYRQGKYEDAISVAETEAAGPYARLALAFVLTEFPDRYDEVLAIYEELSNVVSHWTFV